MFSETLTYERRGHRRFPVPLKLQYTLKSAPGGIGEVTDISSSGLLFQCSQHLRVGEPINVSLAWPFLVNSHCPIQLCISGRIVRSDGFGTALEIRHYEFRT